MDVQRITNGVTKTAASGRSWTAKMSGPSLMILGAVEVVAALSPTTTIGRIAQGAVYMVLGALVWEMKLMNGNGANS